MKRAVASSVLILVILGSVAAAFFIYHRMKGTAAGDPLKAIPADAAFYFAFRYADMQELQTLPWWSALQKPERPGGIEVLLQKLDSLTPGDERLGKLLGRQPLYLSVSATKSDGFDLLYLVGLNVALDGGDVMEIIGKLTGQTDPTVTGRSYEGTEIYEYAVKGAGSPTFTYAVSRNVFIGSFTSFLVEDAIRQQSYSSGAMGEIRKLKGVLSRETEPGDHPVGVSFRNLGALAATFCKPENRMGWQWLRQYGDEGVMQWKSSQHGVMLEGSIHPGDSTQLTHWISTQKPVSMTLADVMPFNTAAAGLIAGDPADWFRYVAQSRPSEQQRNLAQLQDRFGLELENAFTSISDGEFGWLVTEPVSTRFSNNTYFIMRTIDGEEAREVMNGLCVAVDKVMGEATLREKFGTSQIGWLRLDGLIPLLYGELFSGIQKMYFTVIGDHLVFANQPSALRNLAGEIDARKTLLNSPVYRNTVLALREKGNYLYYLRFRESKNLMGAFLSPEWSGKMESGGGWMSGLNSFAFQITGGSRDPQTRLVIRHGASVGGERSDLLWSARLDTVAVTNPFLVRDVATGLQYVLIQDAKFNLYKLNSGGDLIWQIPVDGAVAGSITPIDLYHNNYTQYLFNTTDRLWLIDDSGRPIHNYPIRLPAPATSGLLVAPPDKSHTYRMYIPCGNGKVYAYEGSGKPLNGWNFSMTTGTVSEPLDYLVADGTHYLAGSDHEGNTYILNPLGGKVFSVTGPVKRMKYARWYLQKSGGEVQFVTADSSGSLVHILANGEVETDPDERTDGARAYLFLPENASAVRHVFLVSNRLLGFTLQMEEKLNVQVAADDRPERLRLDSLSDGKLIFIVQSSQSDKTYVHFLSGGVLPGFPVRGGYGNLVADLNNDGKRYLLTVSASGMVYTYSMGN